MVRKILKINLPYSEDPLYVDIDDENKSLKEILQEVVLYLEQQGRFYESQQLKAYISDRNLQIFNTQERNNNHNRQQANPQGQEGVTDDFQIEFRLKNENKVK
jgi:hypothetical protein